MGSNLPHGDPQVDPQSGVMPVGQEWLDAFDADVPDPEHLNGHGGGGGGKLRVDDRPEVRIGKDVHRVIHEVQAALSRDPLVYQRAHRLVTVVGAKHRKGAPIIRELGRDSLLPRLSRHVKMMRAGKPPKLAALMGDQAPPLEWEECVAPPVVTGPLLACGDWPDLYELTGISVTPVFRPDGTIWQEPGYDASTGVLYAPSADYPEVPLKPSRDEASACLEALREVCCDFPFAAPHHEAAWLAGVLTTLARAAIAGPVPMIAVDATTRGTGKSRLVDAAMLLCHGESAARMPLPDEDDEMRKRITALLLEGAAGILLDNITRPILLPSLDAVLTADTWSDRQLGSLTSIRVPARAMWWATGNNLEFGGDLSRRALHVRLESPLENPEEREQFKHNPLLPWVLESRPKLVAAGLTILRAFAHAGAPNCGAPLWGSFEPWSQLIGNVIRWVGMPCALDARASRADDADPSRIAVAAVMRAMRSILDASGERSLPARDFLRHVYEDDEYADVRESMDLVANGRSGKPPSALQLSGAFRRHRGRVIDGHRIVPVTLDSGTKTARWTVEEVT